MQKRTLRRLCAAMALAPLPLAVHAAPDCAAVEQFLDRQGRGTRLLSQRQPAHQKRRNHAAGQLDHDVRRWLAVSRRIGRWIAGQLRFLTPTKDRGVISNGPAPSSGPVPGIQVEGWFADDPDEAGALPPALPRRLERQARRRRRVGNAQRVQRRLGVERLRAAEGLRLRVAEQGRAEFLRRELRIGHATDERPVLVPPQSAGSAVAVVHFSTTTRTSRSRNGRSTC